MKKTAKSHVVGKHPAHAKQTSPTAAHLQKEITSLKRTVAGLIKHHAAPKKHHAATKKHKKPKAKKRGLALGDMAACCAAEALAASLRLSGRPVADEDVLALYARTAADLDAGASILETLEAAWLYGLGGVRPASFAMIDPYRAKGECMRPWRPGLSEELDWSRDRERPGSIPGPHSAGSSWSEPSLSYCPDAVILGVDLPGSHTVLATPDGWWSWGELHDPSGFPDAVIEEAWAVTWR